MRTLNSADVDSIRQQFPALTKSALDRHAVFFDGPAGTQVPQRVIHAISRYYTECNANHGGLFDTSITSDHWLDEAHLAFAQFVGANDGEEIAFGQNMTSLTFAFSRAISQTWQAGDQILVTRLDHDANVTPWVLAARDRGVQVEYVNVNLEDGTLDLADFYHKLNSRTKLLALGCASNSIGTINPIVEMTQAAKKHGALVYLDAVHYAPHALPDVAKFHCDFLACSAYKFFGPHLGLVWGKRQLLEQLSAYKVRPAPNTIPGKWMTGTQSHESIVGGLAAIDYLADLGRSLHGDQNLTRRESWKIAYEAIGEYEKRLAKQLLEGLLANPNVKVYGITDSSRLHERFATFSITHKRLSPAQLASALNSLGIYVWHGNYYALQLSELLGREPEGMVRIGLVHYNTHEEVEYFLDKLKSL